MTNPDNLNRFMEFKHRHLCCHTTKYVLVLQFQNGRKVKKIHEMRTNSRGSNRKEEIFQKKSYKEGNNFACFSFEWACIGCVGHRHFGFCLPLTMRWKMKQIWLQSTFHTKSSLVANPKLAKFLINPPPDFCQIQQTFYIFSILSCIVKLNFYVMTNYNDIWICYSVLSCMVASKYMKFCHRSSVS